MPLTQTSTLHPADAGEGSWDLHYGNVVVALSQAKDGSWHFWGISLPDGLEMGSSIPVEVKDGRTREALDRMLEEQA